MDAKAALVLGLAVLWGTISATENASPSPSPTDEEVRKATQGQEAIPFPPRKLIPIKAKCTKDKAAECEKKNAVRVQRVEKKRLDELNKWLNQMDQFGKENWQTRFPKTAKDYNELSKKYSS